MFSIALYQNYPTPSNLTTHFGFQIAEFSARGGSAFGGGSVTLKIHGVLGREVATTVEEELERGAFKRAFNASHLASGVYFYRLSVRTPSGQTNGFTQTKKLLLLR